MGWVGGRVTHVIKFAGAVPLITGPGPAAQPGQFLKSYDPDAHGGSGEAHWTDDLGEAMKFEDGGDALALWTKRSTVRPLRDDGLPNKPLTACSIEVDRL
jgi:hypothetical protein